MKKISIVVLGLILGVGFILRSYHLDFPSIGYHNMKENQYLSTAEDMAKTGDFKKIYFVGAFFEGDSTKYPQIPLIPYQILISWKLLGNNLWGPRLFNVFFGVFSILLMYLIVSTLFDNIALSLFSAFLLAIMPLAVFFSRNLQSESPAFFFMLLGNFFYLKFLSSLKKYYLLLGGLSFFISWCYKFSFLIGIFPFIFCFPFGRIYKKKKDFFQYILVSILSYLPILIFFLWSIFKKSWELQGVMDRVRLFDIFSLAYWRNYGRIIWWYINGENYTAFFSLLTFLGIIIAFVRRKGLLNRYILGWTFAIVLYGMVFSDFINQHNYYQMPFLGLVCISSTYSIKYISDTIKKFIKKDLFIYLVIFIIVLSAPSVYLAIARQYGTVFWGEDIAGESLKEFTLPDEHIFLLTHFQGYGIARYAQRYVGWPSNLEDFKQKEERFNIRYICIYPVGYIGRLKSDSPLFNYIQNNYSVKEMGLILQENSLLPQYLIFEKNGRWQDIDEFIQLNFNKINLRKTYRCLGKNISFYTIRE